MNTTRPLFFLPDWDDHVDRDHDFGSDTHSRGKADWSNEVYSHELLGSPPFDGLLVSRSTAEKTVKKRERINRLGVHAYHRLPAGTPVIGDCGAFSFKKELIPPYSAPEMVEYYTRLGFDYGVSIDHLVCVVGGQERQTRYDLTIANAGDFLREHRRQGCCWTPVAAVQGWNPDSFAHASRICVSQGYDYIALGSIARMPTRDILRCVQAVREVIPSSVRLHLFGVARLRGLTAFTELGVTSLDSSSYLRQAWLGLKGGYILPDSSYTALRVPFNGPVGLQTAALSALRAYVVREASLEQTFDALMAYDRLMASPDRPDMDTEYRRTLEDRPWERCPCAICQKAGIDVVVFRGSNRNRRRGFHNTFVFYGLLQRLLAGEDVPGLQQLDVPGEEGMSQANLFAEKSIT